MTNRGLNHLQGAALESLRLEIGSACTPRGLEALKGMPLEKLSLPNWTQLTDADALAYLCNFTRLRKLDLSGCEKLTEDTFKQLEMLPSRPLVITDAGFRQESELPLSV